MNTKTIGLCLSGGGHRATAFSLGALLYFADTGLHRHIRAVSSVSGGSITSGFFATRANPLHEQTAEEVEDAVAELAGRITGRPWCSWIAIGAIATVFVVWLLYLVGRFSLPLSFWESQFVFLATLFVVAMVAGPACGGTLWGWWGTWMYVGLVLVALLTGVAIWWSDLHWIFCILTGYLALTLPLYRPRVAEMAFARTVFKMRGRHTTLAELPKIPRYVFCTTEMHTGQHALFSHDLVYVRYQGLGEPGRLEVKTAVQMSANFPVGFPWRFMWQDKYDVYPLDIRQLQMDVFREAKLNIFLMITDGGVYDNMATSWFEEGPSHAAFLEDCLSKDVTRDEIKEELKNRLSEQIDAMKGARQDLLILINASEPYQWKSAWHLGLPLWGEVRMLQRVNDRMYNQLYTIRKRSLTLRLICQPNSGVLISIGEHPYESVLRFRNDIAEDLFLADFGLTKVDTQAYRAKARAMEFPKFDESMEMNYRTSKSKTVKTTLRPLDKETTSILLAHGYLSAMINCHLYLDLPLASKVPTLSDFERLAKNRRREKRPA